MGGKRQKLGEESDREEEEEGAAKATEVSEAMKTQLRASMKLNLELNQNTNDVFEGATAILQLFDISLGEASWWNPSNTFPKAAVP